MTRTKLSYREKTELDQLPARIAADEAESARLQAAIAGPGFYRESATTIKDTLARLETVRDALEKAYWRWDDLDSRSR